MYTPIIIATIVLNKNKIKVLINLQYCEIFKEFYSHYLEL